VAPHDYADILRENVMPVAPAGMASVHLSDGSSTAANESAITQCMLKYALDNKLKNGNDLQILGFTNASHGNSVATLSASDPRVNAKGWPTYDWPKAPLPEVIYPYH